MTTIDLKQNDALIHSTMQPPPEYISSGEDSAIIYVDYNKAALETTFRALAKEWRYKTGMLSSVQDRIIHPAYQRIIGMGLVAIPLILRELRDQPDHWFWALYSITGEDPAANNTNLAEVCEIWLQWGRERGYIE